MTLTVNGHEAEPGCYVDGHWGQYAGRHLLDRAFEWTNPDRTVEDKLRLELDLIDAEWPKNDDGERCGAYGSDNDARQGKGNGPWAAIQNLGDTDGQAAMELSEMVLERLNDVTEGGYWEWWEGEVFLRSYVCPECGRDALNPGEENRTTPGECDHDANLDTDRCTRCCDCDDCARERAAVSQPCDYCCDADEPGCFA